jgi:hypothetical protein
VWGWLSVKACYEGLRSGKQNTPVVYYAKRIFAGGVKAGTVNGERLKKSVPGYTLLGGFHCASAFPEIATRAARMETMMPRFDFLIWTPA